MMGEVVTGVSSLIAVGIVGFQNNGSQVSMLK